MSRSTGADIEAVARAHGVSFSVIIREALMCEAYSVNQQTLKRRQSRMLDGELRYFCIMLGPRMAETIGARCQFLRTHPSAFVDACCLLYVEAHRLL